MRTKVQKWGNSLAVRIPKPFAEGAGLKLATEVEVSLERGTLRFSAVRPRWELRTLVSKVTTRNRHAETDVGESVGRESW
ncbi:MAG: AbrB/MazE/SpoVT family DNA-binding domain-containing protein [Acidobacteriota bacterium]